MATADKIYAVMHPCPYHAAIRKERKGKEEYIASFIYYLSVYLKSLRRGSHSFTCKYTMPA